MVVATSLWPHQFLDHADVVTGFQEVGAEGVPEGMAATVTRARRANDRRARNHMQPVSVAPSITK